MKQLTFICLSLILFSFDLFAQEVEEETPQTIQTEVISVEEPKEVTEESSTTTVKIEDVQNEERDKISKLISKIKAAKVEDRRILMNQLKVQLREMNKESRQNAMKELKESFTSKGHAQHKNQQHKNLQEQQHQHQPKYQQLQHPQGQGFVRGQGQGHHNQ